MAIKRLFIANRGEIAVRILRAAEALGIETVIGISAADKDSLGARMADRAVVLGPAPSSQSYLNVNLILHAALATGCDALHPGYGFLSEKPELSRLCAEHGITFVGPRPETIATLGDKLGARALALEAGVPTVPGTDHIAGVAEAKAAAEALGYPVVMKASAGGGGRGMFKASSQSDIETSFARASREAEAAFGDSRLYMERFVERARHVEVQILGDGEGNVLHFGERDCTVQRRYQKLIEEAPSAALSAAVRERLHAAAVRLTAHARYRNAGTVEFLYDVDRDDFYFIEVNSRIQVEHPVSEAITGQDLIGLQLRVAAGEGLGLRQGDITIAGHAIEVRINAEDPGRDFMPSPGRVTRWGPPEGPGLRLDSHVYEGYLVPPFYDSMVGKLIAHGRSREEALDRLLAAVKAFRIEGIRTTLPLDAFILDHPDFRANTITTRWLEDRGLPAFRPDTE
ncbi:acetyl-CoA carboxylase biotin carboxylase subunit [Chelatococcus asaccharovorans]|uniref:acetyl-CoA carboxylase biotin carboxylase subunit n=1 Tax=Chelatococcus asaccharovorans TaxID=28210 RepID=UPI00224C651E|nr:acetyl-CoA carboxylase biotin carboxylase subunit [Chelatococcus asaccharovorans]CAH1669272.1 Biotin carboxylase 1 [Chelatococcus asaccharovorans]CAH1679301.1 Biotin carboxylase 1 [Chelatococcus asaccharovorans]